MTRPRRPVLNSTLPARVAKIVSSFPIPTPSPGLNLVPRWRTMISPPVTVCPANTFTPRRLAFESRPLRLEPRPFLCAISSAPLADRRDADARQLLAVAGAPLVAALGLELEHAELRPALVRDDLGLHARGRQAVALEHGVAVAGQQQRLQGHGGADVVGQPLHEQGLALAHAVLLAAGLDDCVGHVCLRSDDRGGAEGLLAFSYSVTSLARERRRPPLRPRRRGFEDSAPSSSEPSAAASATGSSGGSESSPRLRLRPAGLAGAAPSSAALARDRRRPAGFS